MKVEDSSGMAIFILFYFEGEALINTSTKDLLNKFLEVRKCNTKLLLKIFFSLLEHTIWKIILLINAWRAQPTYASGKFEWKKIYFPFNTTNDCESNLSSEQDDDSTKLQKFGLESNVQLTPTSTLKEYKMIYSMTNMK